MKPSSFDGMEPSVRCQAILDVIEEERSEEDKLMEQVKSLLFRRDNTSKPVKQEMLNRQIGRALVKHEKLRISQLHLWFMLWLSALEGGTEALDEMANMYTHIKGLMESYLGSSYFGQYKRDVRYLMMEMDTCYMELQSVGLLPRIG